MSEDNKKDVEAKEIVDFIRAKIMSDKASGRVGGKVHTLYQH